MSNRNLLDRLATSDPDYVWDHITTVSRIERDDEEQERRKSSHATVIPGTLTKVPARRNQ